MKKIKSFILFVALCGFLYVAVGQIWFNHISSVERTVVRGKSDVIMVLMGEVNHDFTDIGAQTIRRLNYAHQLMLAGKADYILCVGGLRVARNFSGARVMKDYLVRKGIDADKVFVEPKSYDTKTNMRFASEILRGQNWTSAIIVSSPLHINRIRKIQELDFLKGIDIQFASFMYSQAVPKMSILDRIRHVHYEWMSYGVSALPDPIYQKIVRHIREQDKNE